MSSGSSSKQAVHRGRSEFEILKASHKFLREDEEADESKLPWDDKLAKKYYDNLYREYAVCDLKHYKSGNFALRWRTESEVVSGAGETTCGNTRCALHEQRAVDELRPSLKTLELPFSYVEDGAAKFALVKVVLCDRCLKKLMWKRNKERAAEQGRAGEAWEAVGREEKVLKKKQRVEEAGRDDSGAQNKKQRVPVEEVEHIPGLPEDDDEPIPGLPEVLDIARRDDCNSYDGRRDREGRRSKHRSPELRNEGQRQRRHSRSRSPVPSRGKGRPRPA